MATELAYEVEDYRAKWVDRQLASMLGTDHKARHSQYGRLLDDVTRAAAAQAIGEGHRHDEATERFGRNKFDGMLTEASTPIDHLRYAIGPSRDHSRGEVWSHRVSVLGDVRAKPEMRARMVPEFQRHEIEGIAGDYIAGKTKSAAADRLFVDVLVAMEFYQFADTVVNAPHIPAIAPSIIKRRPILDWFLGRAVSAVCGLIGYGLFWLGSMVGFPEAWLGPVALILVGLFVLEAAWSLIMLPRQWLAVRAAQKKLVGTLDQMNGVYSALGSSGPISAQHVSDLVRKSSDAGVVWPGPLHVLLEDILARGGRF